LALYEGDLFIADSNYHVAAYFDFGDAEIDAAGFDALWGLFEDDESHSDIT